MQNLEIQVIEQKMPVISFNFDEIKATLTGMVAKYQNLIVTEQTLKGCKTTQRELASIRTKIDTYRKDIKREVKKPIDDFEDRCKELISIVTNVENPIKDGLSVYEEKRKKLQQEWLDDIIKELVEKHQLSEKYAGMIVQEERFLNATITEVEVMSIMEAQIIGLKQQQNTRGESIKAIETAINTTNKNMKLVTPLTKLDFRFWIENRPEIDLPEVLKQIDIHGNNRAKAEQKAKEVAVEDIKEEPVEPQAINVGSEIEPISTVKIVLKCKRDQIQQVVGFIQLHKMEVIRIEEIE